MKWEFTNDRSISSQIVEMIQKGILSGLYPRGSNMPSVRALALEAGVNPNTMQKALAELEGQGLLHTQRTIGRTVTVDEGLIMQLKNRVASDYIRRYFDDMQDLGLGRTQAIEMLVSSGADNQSATDATTAAAPTATRPDSPTEVI